MTRRGSRCQAETCTSHGEAEPGGLFKLAAPMMRGAFKRQAENDFRALKAILEEGD